ncbi:thiosulfate sulfurtransferase [Meredithblackwellia eburnea MCA 4105]
MTVPLVIPPTSAYLSDPSAVVLDASWLYEPDPPTRDALKEFNERRFPRARFWSLDDVSEPHPDGYALMFPSPERFAKFAGDHGIEKDSHVIVYDSEGVFSAPRTIFTFKAYGHEKVSLVDGGLPRAVKEGVQLETGPPAAFQKTSYPLPTKKEGSIVEYPEVVKLAARANSSSTADLVLDARPVSAYEEGHIPTSLSLGFPTLLLQDPSGFSYLRDPEDLKAYLAKELGKDNVEGILHGGRMVVNTCGGGLSAAILWLSLQTLGVDSRLYDEAWGGYSARPESVKATGRSE